MEPGEASPTVGKGVVGWWWSSRLAQVGLAVAAVGLAGGVAYVLGTAKVRVRKDRRLREDDFTTPSPLTASGLRRHRNYEQPPPWGGGGDVDATPAYTPEEEKKYRMLLGLLGSNDPEQQTQALQTLHQMSRLPPTHDAMRQVGVLREVMEMLKPSNPSMATAIRHAISYERVMVALTQLIANLASNKINQKIMGEGSTIRDMLQLLDIPNETIKENVLRALMNLSIDPQNEDRIREQDGISLLLNLFQAQDISPALLFQTVRVLVNLSCNETNKAIMVKAGAVDRVVALLLTAGNDIPLSSRLIRLLGNFSLGCDLAVYEKITDRAVAHVLVNFLRKQLETGSKEKEDKSFTETILMTIWKITTERPPKFAAALAKFQDQFIEENETDGSCGIDFIYPYLRLNSTEAERSLVVGCLNALQYLVRGNDNVQAKIRGSGALGALKDLYYAQDPVIAERAAELVKSLGRV